jgi:hypothetical protein
MAVARGARVIRGIRAARMPSRSSRGRLWLMPGLRLFAVVVAAIACAMTSAASAATVARPGGVATAVREYGGTIVFSEWVQAEGRWYLSVREAGAAQRRVAVAPSAMPFDADIGTDSKGRPQLIYQRCAATRTSTPGPMPQGPIIITTRTGCELFVFSLAVSTGERPVRNANDPGRNDVGPTLWRGRIAWTREYGTGTNANPVVYTKLLTAPRSQPSTRLPGVPTTRCAQDAGLVDPPCGPTTNRSVEALELWGDNLGQIVRYVFNGLTGISQTETRLNRISDRSAQQVSFLVTGLNGQWFVGPSFFNGRLAWYRACAVTEASCRTFVGPWRYRISTRRYERGAPGPITVSGFADIGTQLYEVVSCPDAGITEVSAPPPTPDCAITSTAPPAYDPVPPPDLASSQPPGQ